MSPKSLYIFSKVNKWEINNYWLCVWVNEEKQKELGECGMDVVRHRAKNVHGDELPLHTHTQRYTHSKGPPEIKPCGIKQKSRKTNEHRRT